MAMYYFLVQTKTSHKEDEKPFVALAGTNLITKTGICKQIKLRVQKNVSILHKVLTYLEYRAVPGVFQNIDPPPTPLSTHRVCPPPAPKAGGTHSPGGEGGGGSIFWKTPAMGLASYTIISLRASVCYYCTVYTCHRRPCCRWHAGQRTLAAQLHLRFR